MTGFTEEKGQTNKPQPPTSGSRGDKTMKSTVNESQFIDAFTKMNRENNFSYEGRKALFDYLEQYEQDTDTEVELDVIALCCEYSEYANLAEFQKDYSKDYESIEDIEKDTQVIRIDDEAFIIQQF